MSQEFTRLISQTQKQCTFLESVINDYKKQELKYLSEIEQYKNICAEINKFHDKISKYTAPKTRNTEDNATFQKAQALPFLFPALDAQIESISKAKCTQNFLAAQQNLELVKSTIQDARTTSEPANSIEELKTYLDKLTTTTPKLQGKLKDYSDITNGFTNALKKIEPQFESIKQSKLFKTVVQSDDAELSTESNMHTKAVQDITQPRDKKAPATPKKTSMHVDYEGFDDNHNDTSGLASALEKMDMQKQPTQLSSGLEGSFAQTLKAEVEDQSSHEFCNGGITVLNGDTDQYYY